MEKLVYTIWSNDPGDTLAAKLRADFAAIDEVRALQFNLPNSRFSGGQAPIRNLLPRFDGTVNLWLNSRRQRAAAEAVLQTHCDGFHGYAVCESRPLDSPLPAPGECGQVDSLCQVCLLRKPDPMAYDEWLSTWLDSHTDIAIERQGTIAYVQNIVQTSVTADAPEIHGIVEEYYPAAAYADLGLFFGAADDPALMQPNIEALLASTARFIPMDALDRIFTAPYLGSVAAAGAGSQHVAGVTTGELRAHD